MSRAICSKIVPPTLSKQISTPSPLVIAQKIEFLRDNPEQAQIMGRAAREAVKQYSWQRTAHELENILIKANADATSCQPG